MPDDTTTDGTTQTTLQKTKKVKKELWFKTTTEDDAKAAHRIAELKDELGQHESMLAQAKADYKANEERIEGEIDGLLKTVKAKKELRNVECEEVWDYSRTMVYWVHEGSIMDQRPMNESEKQPPLIPDEKDGWEHKRAAMEAEKEAAADDDAKDDDGGEVKQ